jgi:hypothetical protein
MNSAHREASRAKHDCSFPLMERAKKSVATLTPAERALRVKPYQTAVQHLQFGGFGVDDWRHLADAFNFGEVFAQPPFNLANDHAGKFDAAQRVLGELAEQHQRLRTWTARAHQLQAVKDAVEMHEIQLQYAGLGEIVRAERIIVNRIRGALANPGSVTVVEPLQ